MIPGVGVPAGTPLRFGIIDEGMSQNRIIKTLNHVEDAVLVAMVVIMVSSIFLQVIMRYVFNNSLSWSEELGKFMFVWVSWIGISIGQRRFEHIKIEMLTGRLPYRWAMVCNIVSDLIVICICATTAYYGALLTVNQYTTNYAGIRISISWGYLAVTIGCGIMVLRCIGTIVWAVGNFKRGEPPVGDGIEERVEFVVVDASRGTD
jgi:TRAP-type C4-dicarboxylate transport system permease small subunit